MSRDRDFGATVGEPHDRLTELANEALSVLARHHRLAAPLGDLDVVVYLVDPKTKFTGMGASMNASRPSTASEQLALLGADLVRSLLRNAPPEATAAIRAALLRFGTH